MNRGTILFRVDGSARDGMGRLSRCLSLANAMQRRRYQMTFISNVEGSAWPDRIRRFRHAVVRTPNMAGDPADMEVFFKEIATRTPTMVVTDSPAYCPGYLERLSQAVPLAITMTDDPHTVYPTDLVLNPTLGVHWKEFTVRRGGQILAGQRYAMIRSEFRRCRNVRATEPGGGVRILIALGGGGVAEDTAKIAKGLLRLKGVEKVDAVVGSEADGKPALDALVADHSGRLTATVEARDLGNRMTKAHLLITGGGNTALEGACVGMPMLVVARRQHQKLNAHHLDDLGIAQLLPGEGRIAPDEIAAAAQAVLNDSFERKSMSRSGRMLIDGRGADRIVTAAELMLRSARRTKAVLAAA